MCVIGASMCEGCVSPRGHCVLKRSHRPLLHGLRPAHKPWIFGLEFSFYKVLRRIQLHRGKRVNHHCKWHPNTLQRIIHVRSQVSLLLPPCLPHHRHHTFRILSSAIRDLYRHGIGGASDVVLAGCSAGALAVLLNIDIVTRLLPASARVKGLSDAGYFIHAPDKHGAESL